MSDTTEQSKASGAVANAVQTAVIGAAAGVIAALVTSAFTYASRDRELSIRLVEIGIGILRDDPEKSGVSAARRWATTIIGKNSGERFTAEEVDILLRKPIGYQDFGVLVPAPESFEVPAPESRRQHRSQ